jgi:hypothetical protein
LTIGAGVYELTPLKGECRRRCRERPRSGLRFGLFCVGSSIGLMVMLVAVGVMSVTWMAIVAVVILAQKLARPIAAVDARLALAIVGLGTLIVVAPHPIPGLIARCDPANAPITTEERRRVMTDHAMTDHRTGTREEWLAARRELLDAEKELTRRSDELARLRQQLPWVQVKGEYLFESDEGSATLQDLFRGRSQLLVCHFMFGPEYAAGCPSCSAIADGFNGFVVHLEHHDVAFSAVSRAPLAKLQAYKQRMGRGRRRSEATSTTTSR